MTSLWSASPDVLRLNREPLWVEAGQDEHRLRRAEKDIRWLRNIGLVGWFIVLRGHGYELGLTPVWAVYAAGVSYASWAHYQAERTRNIRRLAVATTFSDPVLAGLICLVTGGIDSILYPFFYFTQMSVAIRFGVWESIGIAGFNCFLTVLIFFAEPLYSGDAGRATYLLLATKFFLLGFAGFMGAILAEWAREHASLILEHARTLRDSGDRYQAVLRRFAQVQEEERRNISSELHDRMSGHLFGLRQGIEQCQGGLDDRKALREKLGELEVTVRACTHDVRSIMNELRPTVLDELGFFEAASEHLARHSEIAAYRLSCRIDTRLRDWRSRQDAMLFRLLQEALLNIQKHAQASSVEVVLEPQGKDEVLLSIADDGLGFDPDKVPIGHYGLMTMRERAEAAGGRLSVEAGNGRRGTRIEVRLPRTES
ncbi:ATP-binding protein [Nevskia ramosa]|uniref:ATP-binding protein n=1 Tax=Nevskia ramosa TaxID=64002 RepID=UPI0023530BA3|nr:sensor histidine kinase [Nevskia ramosa]